MHEGPLPLASAARIRALARTSIGAVRELFESRLDPDVRIDGFRARLNLLASALRFCAAAAGELGDPALIAPIVEALEVFPHFDRVERTHVDGMVAGVTSLLSRGAPVTEGVIRLARHPDVRIRVGVAEGLRPTGDAEIALLAELAADPSAYVRKTARKSLDDRVALPWWLGKWSRDPAEIAEDDARAHDATLRAIAKILDTSGYELKAAWPEVGALAAKLPDALAIDLCEGLLRSGDGGGMVDTTILALLLSRPRGGDALVRLLRRWDRDDNAGFFGPRQVGPALSALDPADRGPIVGDLVALARAGTSEDRRELFGASVMAAQIAAKAWPEGEDTEPVLDALLALAAPERGIDSVQLALAPLLARPPRDPSRMRDRALEARRAGYPGAFADLKHHLEALLAALGEASGVEGGS